MSTAGSTLYLSAFIDELTRSGLRHIVVSPGSRSTPLAVLAAEHPELKVWLNIDERSAAFFALGLAKAQREPVALLCTSGTAAANYMPAVVEANLSRVPLVVLTADRPHELRDVGAPQTIDQIDLFGKHVKWFMEMPIPEAEMTMLRHSRIIAARALATAAAKPAGPVHLNFPLREPLLPDLEHPELFTGGRREMDEAAYTSIISGTARLDNRQLKQLAAQLSSYTKGIIICGPHDQPLFADRVTRLAAALKYPVLADPLSQVRSGGHAQELVIEGYDSFLRDAAIAEQLQPEIIIRFGAMPVSKPLLQFIQRYPCRQIVVDEGGWREPTLLASDMITANAEALCEDLLELLPEQWQQERASGWAELWQELNALTMELLQQMANSYDEVLFEGRAVTELRQLLPSESVLFVGNSMPIRDVDTFYVYDNRSIRIMANRGANGIDGLVSTAMGISAAGNRTVLLLGDLSFYHDLNGLLAAKLYQLPITIIVVNNDGGGIFSFLPQASMPRHFEQLFGTPIGLDYSHAVHMYGGSFTRISSWSEFQDAFKQADQAAGLHVIEVPTNRDSNVAMHRSLWPRLFERLNACLHERGRL